MSRSMIRLLGRQVRAFVFDMDGVVTDTASVHARSWKRLFDEYLREHAERSGEPFRTFQDSDYLTYIDGKPRYEGVRDFLASRGIELPQGEPSDPPDRESVCGLGNRKNDYFLAQLREHGADPYPSTVALIRELRQKGIPSAIISSSRNMQEVLQAAGVLGLFDERVDGLVSERLGLRGKPDPAIFLEAARRLGVEAADAVVVEDAISGVEAGRRGGFAVVVGIDRADHADELRQAGADVVVADLADLPIEAGEEPAIGDLPPALDRWDEIAARLRGRTPVVLLDYDGTLTPIVERPEDAVLDPAVRAALRDLARRCAVAVVSGRDLDDVRSMVDVEGIWYAGSHGFDLAGPDGERRQHATEYLPELDRAERDLRSSLADAPGARVERKAFAIAVHYRQATDREVPRISAVVDQAAREHPRLRRTDGKKVFELRPDVPWDKGRASLFLLRTLFPREDGVVPLYVGDDLTDEDAFRVVRGSGIGIVVRGEDDARPTAARYTLRDTGETRALLEGIGRLVEGPGR
ncbi:MAG TPA: trehalose-phosphatase [Actinomycetota bacterium]|jgi:alpha,alpha-trehalase|nr:trehalose-phosphatase [Actinomycetota bacterium]